MDRRGFLKSLVGGVVVAAAAQSFPFRVFSFPTEIVKPKGCEILGEYCDYVNFSDFVLTQSISEDVSDAAIKIAYGLGRSLTRARETALPLLAFSN